MKNSDESVKINHNPNWPYIPHRHYRILIIGDSGSGKTNVFLNLIKQQRPDIDRIYSNVKDPFELKYQLLTNGREKVGIENFKNTKAFLDYSQTIHDVCENLEDCNPTKKRRVLTVFDVMIRDMKNNTKVSPNVTELFLRRRKLNIYLVFISQSYFKVAKIIRLNATHFFVTKILNE